MYVLLVNIECFTPKSVWDIYIRHDMDMRIFDGSNYYKIYLFFVCVSMFSTNRWICRAKMGVLWYIFELWNQLLHELSYFLL